MNVPIPLFEAFIRLITDNLAFELFDEFLQVEILRKDVLFFEISLSIEVHSIYINDVFLLIRWEE